MAPDLKSRFRPLFLPEWLRAWRFREPRPPVAESVLGTRQIFILPTRHGLTFALVLIALGLAAVNYSNALAYLLTFLLASMAVVSLLHSQRNLLGLRVTAASGDPVFAGDPATLRLCLHNDRGPRYALRVESAASTVTPFTVPAQDTRCVALSVPTVQRGWLDCPPLTLASVYPLGIARAWTRRLTFPARCLVYPKPADVAPVPMTAGTEGESQPVGMQHGDDFSGLRVYQAGDALARISWKTLARGQGMHTKEFQAPLAESLWLDWATLPAHDPETRLRLLCRAVLDADRSGIAYGLRLPGIELEPDTGAAHRHRCLEALALHEIHA